MGFRFSHYVNGSTNLNQWSNLDRIDFEQSLLIPENEAKNQKIRQRNKLKSEICQTEFYIDQLFKHCEYYESKDEYLKIQIAEIEIFIDTELDCQNGDILQQTKQILERIDLKKIKQHMLKIDITLKLKEIHKVLDEHPFVKDKICKDGMSKHLFANAVVNGTYNERIARNFTNYRRMELGLNEKDFKQSPPKNK